MKRISVLLGIVLMCLYSGICYSQQVVSSAGGQGSGTNVQLSWTVGEPVIETFAGPSAILTQGFHQSKLLVTAINPLVYPGISLEVYPNPVTSALQLQVKGEDIPELMVRLFDMNGRLVYVETVEALPGMISMEKFTPGTYLLKVYSTSNDPLKTFKVIKN